MSVGVVILAAGSGSRAKTDKPKQYMELGGVTVLRRSIDAFLRLPEVSMVQVVIAASDVELYQAATKGLALAKPVHGGNSRQESSLSGLKGLLDATQPQETIQTVLIHDGARPFPNQNLIKRVIAKVAATGEGAIPAIPVSDTLKRAEDGVVSATIDRTGLWQAQTPQGFPFNKILAAHNAAIGKNLTDDAAVAECAGINLHICQGNIDNIKLTHLDDFARARAKLGGKTSEIRTGLGIDVHRLVENNQKSGVTLCGVNIAHEKSLKGHSDADVALHALTDALLGAIAMGDIGDHFPPSNEKWRGVASSVFLKHAQSLLSAKGGRILNIDITIVCEAPKIAPYRIEMRQSIAEMLNIDIERISVKATTSEKLGFMGRGEGILSEAIVTVVLNEV
jgi:2-C-methyl-D-erythritol 4-phosphate cytidylyltransferase/2-C-methyl-D-erythritol 2,4-cyclodiphosphate synthase